MSHYWKNWHCSVGLSNWHCCHLKLKLVLCLRLCYMLICVSLCVYVFVCRVCMQWGISSPARIGPEVDHLPPPWESPPSPPYPMSANQQLATATKVRPYRRNATHNFGHANWHSHAVYQQCNDFKQGECHKNKMKNKCLLCLEKATHIICLQQCF